MIIFYLAFIINSLNFIVIRDLINFIMGLLIIIMDLINFIILMLMGLGLKNVIITFRYLLNDIILMDLVTINMGFINFIIFQVIS